MRNFIPFFVMALLLTAGVLGFLTTEDVIPSLENDNEDLDIYSKPVAEPTSGLDQPKPKANIKDDRGSRFAMTTNTILTIDTPSPNSKITFADQVTISGHLFEDYDNNGTYDANVDIPIPGAEILVLFAGGDKGNQRNVTTDSNGKFQWEKVNDVKFEGPSEIEVRYSGQYTINGSQWFPVSQQIGVNEDKDYFIDVNYTFNTTRNRWEYIFPGNEKFDIGALDTVNGTRYRGDVIVDDSTGLIPGVWDSGDTVLRDPLKEEGGVTINQYYTPPGTPGRVDFYGPLIDEEFPDASGSGRWADDDGDWNRTKDDVGSDGKPGTNDADGTEGDGWPDVGEPHVDEDIYFIYYRKASSCLINITLWNPSFIEAKVYNSSGGVIAWSLDSALTQKYYAVVGETIDIIGELKNLKRPGFGVGGRAIKFKIFGGYIDNIVRTDSQGVFNFSYTIPTTANMRVGMRDIDIIYNEELFDPAYDPALSKYPSYLNPTSLSNQNEIISLRIFRPTTIILENELEDEDLIGYLWKSIDINGTLVDDNGDTLSTMILHDNGETEVILPDAYELSFEWGLRGNRYWDYLERDLLDASGNFSILDYEITDPRQELGDIRVKFVVTANQSQTYYLSAEKTTTVTVRGSTIMNLWIDQDRDGKVNEHQDNMKGALADWITRKAYEDPQGKVWNFNNVVVYGRLAIKETEDGINGKTIQYKWEDEPGWEDDEIWRTTTTQPIDIDLNGKFSKEENGMFIIPDPDPLQHEPPKIINPSDPMGPLTLKVKYEETSGYYDTIEVIRDFDVVAMTRIVIQPGSGIKGENITIKGRLLDDLGKGVSAQDIKLYWEDLKGELLEDDKFNQIKLNDAYIGNVTTDEDGKFSFYSESILTRDIDVGQGYVVAIFDGSVRPYTSTDAFIGSTSDEVPINVSSHTKIKLTVRPKKLIRGKHFTLEGTIIETYQGDENTDSRVLLTIADAGQMEMYIRNVDQTSEIRITNLEVEFKSEGGFSVTGVVPYNLDVSQAALRLVFNGTKDTRYLKSQIISYYEIWTETYIKILSPETIEKDDGSGYLLRDDLEVDTYDEASEDFIAPLIFRIQLLEVNPTEGAEPKPIADGKILLNISGKYSVFTNYSAKFTDKDGYANFSFRKPLADTDWGYQLPSKAAVELEIGIEFTGYIKDEGKSYFEPSKTLMIDTTHHPPSPEPTPSFYDEYGWLIWTVVVIVIVFLIIFFFAMRWYTKQQRIRGMRRIIKRAADQLIAGNEYTAVIFKSYQKLGVHLRKYGYLRRESETFREFEDAVRTALPIDRMSMDDFLKLLEEARYSTHQIGENQRNDAIRNLRAIERSLDRIIIDEDAALRALERLETEGVKETEIVVAPKSISKGGAPQLLKGSGRKSLPSKGETIKK